MTRPIDRALILAAGLGTRLRPLTNVRAKPAIPVAGEPLIRRIVGWLVANGVADLVVNLHHLPETVTAVLGDGSDLGARVRYSWEQPVVLGSAGGPRQALPILGAETFYIVNGDTLTDLELPRLGAAHAASEALVTLALTPNYDPARYGGVRLDGDAVTGFVPRGDRAKGSFHFIGVQAAAASAFRDLPAGSPAHSIGGVYDRLLAQNPGSVRGFVCDARFYDIGTIEDYVRTCRALAPGSASAISWSDVEIGAAARLEECIVTDGARVPAGASYTRHVLMRGPDGRLVALPWTNHHG